ncbi:MAG TPA: hypothetical protein VFL83_03060 [Anaeromyxobacter sp.]|nr:hypothetical protein [Anaeromyxobacter sp.]
MIGRGILAVVALFVAGCAARTQVVVLPFEISSQRELKPEQRAEAWRRAVNAFDWTGRTASVSDESGGVLQSVEQGSVIQCSEWRGTPLKPEASLCKANESTRFTIGDDGVARVRMAGRIAGTVPNAPSASPLLSDRDREQQQARLDRWLDFVLGKTDYKPEPPNPPLASPWPGL